VDPRDRSPALDLETISMRPDAGRRLVVVSSTALAHVIHIRIDREVRPQ
jgi:hypothetical protein